MTADSTGVPRRALLSAAVWSVPVVAAAAAAPLAAASGYSVDLQAVTLTVTTDGLLSRTGELALTFNASRAAGAQTSVTATPVDGPAFDTASLAATVTSASGTVNFKEDVTVDSVSSLMISVTFEDSGDTWTSGAIAPQIVVAQP